MNHILASTISFSILVPGVMALFQFKKINRSYYPFIFCLWLGGLNEVLSAVLIHHHRQNLINNNIYALMEYVLMCWYFLRAGIFANKNLYHALFALPLVFWIVEMFAFKNISEGCTYFRIFSSMLIVGMSMELFNKILTAYHPRILNNPDFLLCSCFIIYFIYRALIQSYIIYGATRLVFFTRIYVLFIYINLVINLLYIIAILWMPRKVSFTLPLL